MALPQNPIIKKFFSNKIESSRENWYNYLIKIARIFYKFDGEPYNRERLLEEFVSISKREEAAERDASNFRDEFGAYGSYLGLYHLERDNDEWIIKVSNSAKRFLCGENPNATVFCRVQLSLFQYPNGMGAAVSDNGSVSVQGNVKNDTMREVSSGVRLNPFRIICKLIVALHEEKQIRLDQIRLPYAVLLCVFNDDRIYNSYNPSVKNLLSAYSDYSSSDYAAPASYSECLTNFKRNFHILEKTGLIVRDSRFGLMISQANYDIAYDCIKTISEIDVHYDAFDSFYENATESDIRNIIASNSWGEYYDVTSLPKDKLSLLGAVVDDGAVATGVNVETERIENNDELTNEYIRAANYLRVYADENGVDVSEFSTEVDNVYTQFKDKFSPDKLEHLSDAELRTVIFYTAAKTNDSLCYWLEMDKDCKRYMGSISGGSAFKFGLFQNSETEKWMTGSPAKPQELSDQEALELGRKIRDALVIGAKVIESSNLETVDDYEKLDDELNQKIGNQFAKWTWIHKYFSMIFPRKLSSYHSDEWQRHILYALRIRPSSKYYARSGQIAMVSKYNDWVYWNLSSVCREAFGSIKHFCRLGTTSETKSYASEWKRRGIVAIGWGKIGSLEDFVTDKISKKDVAEKLQEEYYQNDASTATRKAGELQTFYNSGADTVFVAMNGEKTLALVDGIGAYTYEPSEEMAHIKTGTWRMAFSSDEKLPYKSAGHLTSCYELTDEQNLMFLYDKYFYFEDNGDETLDTEEGNESIMTSGLENCLEIELTPRTNTIHPLNFIIYGAPGTGKTYSTAEYAIAIIEGREVDLGRKTDEDRKIVMAQYNELIRNGQVAFTTFHQSYGYEEFIQGLRPDVSSGGMSFKKTDGVFKHIADVALNDPSRNYVVIIDEINRANISKVFGELITLLEDDKRWGEVNAICATLQSGDVFAVPNNLYVIGTMNSADKSISLIDSALRRRFEFIEQKPNPDLIDDMFLRKVFSEINDRLASELDSTDLLIGHSYFMKKSREDLCGILNRNIIPLLYEYFYDNRKKVAALLNDVLKGTDIVVVNDPVGRLYVKTG